MNLHELKQRLQDHFADGLVTIVGSGLSVAEGIPGMKELAKHLLTQIPAKLPPMESKSCWLSIKEKLEQEIDLETVLLRHPPDSILESVIISLTANFILDAEMKIIREVVSGEKTLRFSSLLNHMLKPNTGIPVITTNYDRLIEIASESVGLGVDTLFAGNYWGQFDPKRSQASLCCGLKQRRKQVYRQYSDHVVLLKPHGSLDWFRHNDNPVCCPFPLENQRLIITPGLNKFRDGYDRPFDSHRERANREIDRGSRYLIIGYGFNDDHLQTHLEQQLRAGKPAVVITRGLSSKVKELLPQTRNLLAISAGSNNSGTKVTTIGEEEFFPNLDIWDLKMFINEVLES